MHNHNRNNNFVCADAPSEPSLVLILKWGGELTPAGRIQAEELGRIFRCMYPGGQGRHLAGSYAAFYLLNDYPFFPVHHHCFFLHATRKASTYINLFCHSYISYYWLNCV